MTQDGEYDLTPEPPKSGSPRDPDQPKLKPGDPGWVPPEVIIEKAVSPAPPPEEPPDPDVEKHKGLALLGYICFLIPLLAAPNSKFARYHANQGLLAFIVGAIAVLLVIVLEVAMWLAGKLLADISILNLFFSCIFHLLQFVLLVGWVALSIMGIIHAANGERKPLPVVGHWNLIK